MAHMKRNKKPSKHKNLKRKRNELENKKKIEKKDVKFKPDVLLTECSLVSYKDIFEGLVMLGCIKKVTEYNLIVGLPNRMVGYVNVQHLSQSYAKLLTEVSSGNLNAENVLMLQDLYEIGEFIVVQVASVVDIYGRINIKLTTEPNKLNISLKGSPLVEGTVIQCSVTSEIENGFIMDTGLPTVRAAFLSKEYVPQTCGVGKVLMCFVMNTERDSSTGLIKIKLSAQNKVLPTLILNEDSSFSSFHPGSAADVTVTKIAEYGLQVNCGEIKGVVSRQHLPIPYQKPSEYEVGQVLRARVLYSTEIPPMIYFSMLPVLCSLGTEDSSVQSIKDMEVIENARVYGTNNREAFFYLRDNICGVCAINEFRDMKKDCKVKVGTTKNCRVIGYHPMDDIYVVGVKKSLMEQKDYSRDTVQIGEEIMVKLLKFVKGGAVVKLGKFLMGFVPTIHLNGLKDLPRGEIAAKVLTFKEESKVFFTLREDLLHCDFPLVTEFDKKCIRAKVAGVVFLIKTNGIVLEFFNGVTGFLPETLFSPKMSAGYFSIGSLVECKVKKFWTNDTALLTMEEDWDEEGTKGWIECRSETEIRVIIRKRKLERELEKKFERVEQNKNIFEKDKKVKKKKKLNEDNEIIEEFGKNIKNPSKYKLEKYDKINIDHLLEKNTKNLTLEKNDKKIKKKRKLEKDDEILLERTLEKGVKKKKIKSSSKDKLEKDNEMNIEHSLEKNTKYRKLENNKKIKLEKNDEILLERELEKGVKKKKKKSSSKNKLEKDNEINIEHSLEKNSKNRKLENTDKNIKKKRKLENNDEILLEQELEKGVKKIMMKSSYKKNNKIYIEHSMEKEINDQVLGNNDTNIWKKRKTEKHVKNKSQKIKPVKNKSKKKTCKQ